MGGIHEKLSQAISVMTFHYPYYAEILLGCIFTETDRLPTAGVRATRKGFEFSYNPNFVDSLSQEQVNYLVIHEAQHILSSHGQRCKDAQLDHELMNIAADMVINNNIEFYGAKDGKSNLLERPSADLCLIPKDYTDEKIMEYVYNFLIENDKWSKDPEGKQYYDGMGSFDEHEEDEVSQDMREAMVNDMVENIRRRGFATSDFESVLSQLRTASVNYLNKIKAAIANAVGKNKNKTWFKPSRRGELSRGVKKYKDAINVILDTSGSMNGTFEFVLSYIFHSGIEINLIQCDTEIKEVCKIKSKQQLQRLKIKGFGGTEMSKAVDYVVQKLNNYPTILLTDGWVGEMDVSSVKKDFMILYTEDPVRISGGIAKQYKIKKKK